MIDLNNIKEDFNIEFSNLKKEEEIEEIRLKFLGKKGIITELFLQLKNLPNEEKKNFGAKINLIRDEIAEKINERKIFFENQKLNEILKEEKIDITEPFRFENKGLIHPINKTIKEIQEIFGKIGFEISDGPEIEDDFYNFTALNMPKNHPARQMQDSFYLQNCDKLLRTHTSTIQIRKMVENQPPLRVIALGKVFRRDSDQTHTPMFHQIEGFVVDEKANMANLKWVLEEFLRQFFQVKNIDLRFRPSFFPFTEPSAEVDIGYKIDQNRIQIGFQEKFMEILGCGMIHPNVLENCKIDSKKYQGFAFGMGIERLTMLKYGITDLRMLFENDLRFLNHYGFKDFEF